MDELKQKCIDATDLWNSIGRPRSGDINNNRIRCKLQYKNAIKEAAANADCAFNDCLYEKLCKKENTAFWKAWRRRFCSSKLKPASTINGSSGDENIRHEFTHYFKSIVTPASMNVHVELISDRVFVSFMAILIMSCQQLVTIEMRLLHFI